MGKHQSVMASEGSVFDVVPDDILAEIFLRLPGRDIVKSCVRVCKTWNCVANTQTLWKDKCDRDLHMPQEMIRILYREDFKRLYFKNPYGRNLIRNPDASKGLKCWTVTHKGGDGFQVEREPIGADPVEDYAQETRSDRKIGCWATSYHTCKKDQLIDLVKEGCSAEVLDQLRPDIIISEWVAARFDCGIKYKLNVKLLGDQPVDTMNASSHEADIDREPLDYCEIDIEEMAGRVWYPANHTFTGYPPGVRYIHYIHEGKDNQFWKGHFGAKMTLATVKFDVRHCSGSFQSES